LSISVFSQENKKSLYARGLQACVEKEVAEYSTISARNLRSVIVSYNFDITSELPKQLGEITIQYLTDNELADKYKSLPKKEREQGIPYIKLFPLYDKNQRLYFSYNNYWFTYAEKGGFFSRKKFMYTHGLEGGCHAEIEYDSTRKKFVIKNVELWGI
jgi:hypothetical protein